MQCEVPGCDRDHSGKKRTAYGLPDYERFWHYVQTQPNGCKLFRRGRKSDGYGMFATDRPRPTNAAKTIAVLAHRFAWELAYGRAPIGELDHLCYTRNCVAVEHLVESTRADNLAAGNERRRAERAAYNLVEASLRGVFSRILVA